MLCYVKHLLTFLHVLYVVFLALVYIWQDDSVSQGYSYQKRPSMKVLADKGGITLAALNHDLSSDLLLIFCTSQALLR